MGRVGPRMGDEDPPVAASSTALPVLHITADGPPLAASWSFFWSRRDAVIVLARRLLGARYQQTLLGVGWAFLHPLLAIGVFTWLLSSWSTARAPESSWLAHNTSGWVPWGFFAATLTSSAASLSQHASLLRDVALPRLALPLASLAARCVDLAIALVVLIALLALDGTVPAASAWLFPLPLAGLALLGLGIGLALASFQMRWRDVGQVLPYLLQLGLFATPVVVPAAVLEDAWPPLRFLNPAWGHIAAARSTLLGLPLDGAAWISSWAWTAAALGGGLFVFARSQRRLAEWA